MGRGEHTRNTTRPLLGTTDAMSRIWISLEYATLDPLMQSLAFGGAFFAHNFQVLNPQTREVEKRRGEGGLWILIGWFIAVLVVYSKNPGSRLGIWNLFFLGQGIFKGV